MGWTRSDMFLPDRGVRAGTVAGSWLYWKASEVACGIPCHMTRGIVRGSGLQCGVQRGTPDYARDQESRDASVAASGIYGTEYEASCELPCLARATCGVLSVMRGMLRDPRARTLSWTTLRVPLRAPDPVKASSFHAGVNAAAGNPHADMMKRFYPDTATGPLDLEAIQNCTPARQQGHNPHARIRIGEASHPGPIDLPSFAARQVGRCRRSSCQRVLTTNDTTLQCPVCDAYPLCSECHIRAQRIGRCECPMSGRPVPIECRMDGYFSPAGQHIAHPSETIPVVPCPIPGCDQRLNGFGKRLDHACRHCWTLPVCDKCHKDPPPKWCRCDLQEYMERRNQMDYGSDTPGLPPNPPPQDGLSPVLRFMLATALTTPPSSVEGPAQTGGGGARSSGDNRPPGTTVVTAERRGCSGAKSSGAHHQPRPLVWPEPRVSTHRQKSVGQYLSLIHI